MTYAWVNAKNVCNTAFCSWSWPTSFLNSDFCCTHFTRCMVGLLWLDICSKRFSKSLIVTWLLSSAILMTDGDIRCIVCRPRSTRSKPLRASVKTDTLFPISASSLMVSLKVLIALHTVWLASIREASVARKLIIVMGSMEASFVARRPQSDKVGHRHYLFCSMSVQFSRYDRYSSAYKHFC